MKIITIGRDENADIRIDDELVSRRHATIKILPLGKMEIRDLSKNGTFVNGTRLAVNKPCRITRKDIVSFARVSQLDWKEVPDPTRPYRLAAIGVAVLLLVLLVVSLISKIDWNSGEEIIDNPGNIEQFESSREGSAGASEKQLDGNNDAVKSPVPEKAPKLFPDKKKKDKSAKSDENKSKKSKDGEESREKKEKYETKEKEQETSGAPIYM